MNFNDLIKRFMQGTSEGGPDRDRVLEIDLRTMYRRVVYDSGVPNTEAVSNYLGLPPISQDVAEEEKRASDERTSVLDPLAPLISEITQYVVAAILVVHCDLISTEHEIAPESVAALTQAYRGVAVSSAVTVLSTLFDLDIIGYTHLRPTP